MEGRVWRTARGPLRVMEINTRGDEAGWVELAGGDGVKVADIIDVVIYQSTDKVYQRILQQSIIAKGSGFRQGMSFDFDPPMKADRDYKLTVDSNQQVTLHPIPKNKSKWPFLSQHTYSGTPILIKNVMLDGFTNTVDTKIYLSPTGSSSRAFKVIGVLEDSIRIQLKANQRWSAGLSSMTTILDDIGAYRISPQMITTHAPTPSKPSVYPHYSPSKKPKVFHCYHDGRGTSAVTEYGGSNTLTGLRNYVLTSMKAYGYVYSPIITTQSPSLTPSIVPSVSTTDGYFTTTVTTLDTSTFDTFIHSHDYVFIHFQTPFPAWSARLGDVLNQLVYLLQSARVSVAVAQRVKAHTSIPFIPPPQKGSDNSDRLNNRD
eukprot:gene38414-47432_t